MQQSTDPASAHDAIQSAVDEVLVGNDEIVERLTIALLADGHVLLEGVPGVAKTTIAELFARATGLDASRIQLTPDTLPADITGSAIYREATGEFEIRKGPVFANLVIADEINRATPKTQSALLESMQERRVTIDGDPHDLPEPFLVVATQNPIEMEGTFELPEAQRDRFSLKLTVGVPDREIERSLLDRFNDSPSLGPSVVDQVIEPGEVPMLREAVADVHVSEAVGDYLLDIIEATRSHDAVSHGASPRAALHLQDAVKARAAIHGREYVLPDDVKALAQPVLAHRVVLGTDAALGNVDPASLIEEILESLEPPSAATPDAPGDGSEPDDSEASLSEPAAPGSSEQEGSTASEE
ncbi:AAA family ATPase [Salinarchaeum laminariae]|uniref:AAA family ATPase n=1 Tax=Salinarchaeum laminariae TaxID=869888 RepID=UPI0020C187A7|nr:MoxR family ATPase [Salinarchaeum laminariae]